MTTQIDNTQAKTGLANIKEAAAYMRVSRDAIYKMLADGRLPFEMVGSHKRIAWADIYRFCKVAGSDVTSAQK